MRLCPCGTNQTYDDCCGKFISGKMYAATPEELMRSRFTAYKEMNIDYIAKTMKSPVADYFDIEEAKKRATQIFWTKLEVINSSCNPPQGYVEFKAHYVVQNKKCILHELSEFKCVEERWYYVDGKNPQEKINNKLVEKIGRNEMCPCGSAKKYKKCCGM